MTQQQIDLPRLKWSIDEYHKIIDSGLLSNKQVELIRGEIIEMVPEGESHAEQSQAADRYLAALLGVRAWVRQAKPITLPNGSEPQPDIAICQPIGREYRTHHPYPENIYWLIEYSNSTLERDLQIKSQIYAESGIPEYWIINLKTNELIILRNPNGSEYASQQTLKDGTLCSLAFPDLAIDVLKIISP